MFDNIKQRLKQFAGAAAVALVSVAGPASAQTAGVDVSSVTTAITSAATAGATIGLAILAMHYGIKLYKWVRQAG